MLLPWIYSLKQRIKVQTQTRKESTDLPGEKKGLIKSRIINRRMFLLLLGTLTSAAFLIFYNSKLFQLLELLSFNSLLA